VTRGLVTGGGSVVGHLVDTNNNSEDQRVVLAGSNLDAIGIPNAEPTLGDISDMITVAFDLHCVPDVHGLLLDFEELVGGRSRRISVSRRRSVLPPTLNARSPAWLSIQQSSPIENIFSRIWVLRLIGIMIASE
jgi:hypothetical protein